MIDPAIPAIRKILLAHDFSPHSREALQLACDLSRRYDATLAILYVYQPPTYFLPPDAVVSAGPEVLARQTAESSAALDVAKQEAEALGAPHVSASLAEGEPFVQIIREAKRGGYDLIVMGTHGRTGLRHALIGSVAERVVRKAPCPVLTVPRNEHRFEPV